jgi:protein SCO1
MSPNRRNILLGAAGLALGGIAALIVWRRSRAPAAAVADDSELGVGLDDVALLDEAGARVRWGDLKGKPRALFFGFTHCPVICPVTVFELNDALDRIGAPAADVAIDFVSIDPERDTPERLREYFSGFGERIHGYTGTPEAIARIAESYEIIYRRAALEGDDYTMDHTTTVFLLNPAGDVVDVVAYGSPAELIEQRLRALVVEAA